MTNCREKDFDYSEYLGPNYQRKMAADKRISTVVSNHVSWLDPVVLLNSTYAAFSPSAEFAGVPVLNVLMDAIDCIYIPRGGNDESR